MRPDAETCDRIVAAIAKQVHEPTIHLADDTELARIGFDSIDLVYLSMILETEHEIEISDQDLEETKTVGDLLDLVARKMAPRTLGRLGAVA
jgi:acyl carrier protein